MNSYQSTNQQSAVYKNNCKSIKSNSKKQRNSQVTGNNNYNNKYKNSSINKP